MKVYDICQHMIVIMWKGGFPVVGDIRTIKLLSYVPKHG